MKYKNPIIKGFHPDPSVCRVGDDYYLATSTFEYFPGIALFHSRDLVNWEPIGHCLTHPEQLDYSCFESSGGIWAPTIRYYGGRFYVTATADGMGNMILHTDDIYGEWSNPVWVDMGGIDPSMLFDGGKCYYCTNARGADDREAISVAEVDPDTGRLLTTPSQIWYGIGEGWLEGPHIYHIGDWYYILTSEGGTSYNHMISIGRSKNIFGSYESCPDNPIMTNRNDTSKQVQCSGHGDLVDDADGNLHMVHLATRCMLGTRTTLGRETFLTPVISENDWIKIPGKKALLENDCGDTVQKPDTGFICDFKTPEWEPQWQFIRTPAENVFMRSNDGLKITAAPLEFTSPATPSFIGIAQPDFSFEASADISFDAKNDEDEAGIMAYLQADAYYRLALIRKSGGLYITVKRQCDDMSVTDFEVKTDSREVCFKITGDCEKYHFYADDNLLCSVSARFLCTQTVSRCFTGTMIGLYTAGSGSDTYAHFKHFSIK